MDAFDPRGWWPAGSQEDGDRGDRGPENHDRLLTCGLAAALCLCVGSFQPTPGMAATATAFLLVLAALGSALEAVWRGEPVWAARRLTAWDQAAALFALALLLRGLADPASASAGAAGAAAESCVFL